MKKLIFKIVFILYIIIAIFVTICLLAYNDYKVSEFSNISFLILEEDTGDYDKNDLLIVSKGDIKELKKGNTVFYYNLKSSNVNIKTGEIEEIDIVTDKEYILNFSDDNYVSSNYLIGSTDDVIDLGFLGTILNALESRIGYLITIILPIFLSFLYQIYALMKELKTKKL